MIKRMSGPSVTDGAKEIRSHLAQLDLASGRLALSKIAHRAVSLPQGEGETCTADGNFGARFMHGCCTVALNV
jgi:hypothetical protein